MKYSRQLFLNSQNTGHDNMITLTRAGIFIFAVAVVLGPLYTVDGYSVVANLISELGAQHTRNNFVMNIAFILLGLGIAIDGVRKFRGVVLPFILFGLAMALVGLLSHKPVNPSLEFNATSHNLHGVIASVAGTVLTLGFIWQGFLVRGRQRMICLYLAGVAIVFPLLMLAFPAYQGIIQRCMYLQIFWWLWVSYPQLEVNQAKNKNR